MKMTKNLFIIFLSINILKIACSDKGHDQKTQYVELKSATKSDQDTKTNNEPDLKESSDNAEIMTSFNYCTILSSCGQWICDCGIVPIIKFSIKVPLIITFKDFKKIATDRVNSYYQTKLTIEDFTFTFFMKNSVYEYQDNQKFSATQFDKINVISKDSYP